VRIEKVFQCVQWVCEQISWGLDFLSSLILSSGKSLIALCEEFGSRIQECT
jgi:hypothetical protein